jgi:SAM-dependent methyltransferase
MKGTWLAGRPENVYASKKRLAWLVDRLSMGDRILELGCGTGVMITVPLAQLGYQVTGVDRDELSIAHGRKIAVELDADPSVLQACSLGELAGAFDAVIVSEVLEHLSDHELDALLGQLALAVRRGGRLLVTVPNGYGWYEFESTLWRSTGLGRLVEGSWFERGVRFVKMRLSGYRIDQLVDPYPSSLDASPHVQHFRHASLAEVTERFGFVERSFSGSGLFAGQLSNLLWTGLDPVTRFNNWLGTRCPAIASGFFVEFERV